MERQGILILCLRPTCKLLRMTSGGVTVILLGGVVVLADELEDLWNDLSELSSVSLEQ